MTSPALDAPSASNLCDALLGFVDDHRLGSLESGLRGFNHRFRNLLNGLRMGLYLARRNGLGADSPRWGRIDQAYAAIEQFQNRLQSVYQAVPLTPIVGRFGALVNERGPSWIDRFRQNGNALILEAPERESEGRFDPMFLGAALDNFVAWRAETLPGEGRATLRWSVDRDGFAVDWSEEAGERSEPPAETDPNRLSATTAALSLPLLARVVAEHGGRLSWSRQPRVEARLRWPLSLGES